MIKARFAILCALIFGVSMSAVAAGLSLIYENDEAVSAGRSWPALPARDGSAIPSETALAFANSLLLGDGDGLYRGEIARLDNDLNLAIVRRGERVSDDALQSSHARRWQAAQIFIGASAAGGMAGGAASSAAAPEVVTIAPRADTGPFLVKINGREPSEVPVLLNERFRKSKFRLDVVNTSTVPVWNVSVKLTAEPDLSFWKEGRRTGLNDVPAKTFEYVHQAIFKPLKPGAGFAVPVEVYFIKERDYVLTFNVTSKGQVAERKALVRFE